MAGAILIGIIIYNRGGSGGSGVFRRRTLHPTQLMSTTARRTRNREARKLYFTVGFAALIFAPVHQSPEPPPPSLAKMSTNRPVTGENKEVTYVGPSHATRFHNGTHAVENRVRRNSGGICLGRVHYIPSFIYLE